MSKLSPLRVTGELWGTYAPYIEKVAQEQHYSRKWFTFDDLLCIIENDWNKQDVDTIIEHVDKAFDAKLCDYRKSRRK